MQEQGSSGRVSGCSMVVMPALAMEMVCCSMACAPREVQGQSSGRVRGCSMVVLSAVQGGKGLLVQGLRVRMAQQPNGNATPRSACAARMQTRGPLRLACLLRAHSDSYLPWLLPAF